VWLLSDRMENGRRDLYAWRPPHTTNPPHALRRQVALRDPQGTSEAGAAHRTLREIDHPPRWAGAAGSMAAMRWGLSDAA
jgi:hypothetical protein